VTDKPATRALQVEIPDGMDPALAKFVERFAQAMARELHAAEQVFSHHDVVIEIEEVRA